MTKAEKLKAGREKARVYNEQDANEYKKELSKIIKEANTPGEVIEIIESIQNDKSIEPIIKQNAIDFSIDIYIERYKELPNNYDELKKEIKLFNNINNVNFILIAQRLKKIRDEQIYKKDNHDTFKEFYDCEGFKETTVFTYIGIVENFSELFNNSNR